MIKDFKTVIIERKDLRDFKKCTPIDRITVDTINKEVLSLNEIRSYELIIFVDYDLSSKILKSRYTKLGEVL